jgi:hypothetical protein
MATSVTHTSKEVRHGQYFVPIKQIENKTGDGPNSEEVGLREGGEWPEQLGFKRQSDADESTQISRNLEPAASCHRPCSCWIGPRVTMMLSIMIQQSSRR